MKKILVTGSGSYLGQSFVRYMCQWSEEYQVDAVSTSNGDWQRKDFSGYDAVYCTAGLAHIRETAENRSLYKQINCDLACMLAEKSRNSGVRQFIYLSSMSVYGLLSGVITPDTRPKPTTAYGRSKLLAEERLIALSDDTFTVTVLRPPMVYGKDCKGNFQAVLKLVRKISVFPLCQNSRSMIYVDHLSAFVKRMIDDGRGGVFFPQNREYVTTSRMAELIAQGLGKSLHLSRMVGVGVRLLQPVVPIVRKAFGDLYYKNTETLDFSYCTLTFEETIRRSI